MLQNVGMSAGKNDEVLNDRPHLGRWGGGEPPHPPDSFSWLHAIFYDRELIFSIGYILNFFLQSFASDKFLWPLVVELWYCSQDHVTTQWMQMFPVVNIVTWSSTSMINPAIRVMQMQFGNDASATASRWKQIPVPWDLFLSLKTP